jgi:biopolymer transport protein TolQ
LTLSSKDENKGSHLARVTSAGITEFIEGKESKLGFEEQISTAQRGCDRAASIFNQELRKGLSILATIATSAPFIGLFGTISGIINAFRGMALTGSGGIGAVASGIAEALITTAFGIAVAVIALWFYNILNGKVEVYDAEMANTSSQVVDFFMRQQKA